MKQLKRITVFLLLIAVACSDSSSPAETPKLPREKRGPEIVVEAGVKSAQVDIGDRVEYKVVVRHREDVEVEWPPFLAQLDHQVVFEAGNWQDEDPAGNFKVRSLTAVLDPGIGPVLEISATSIKYRRLGEENWLTMASEVVTVEITSVVEGGPEFLEPLDGFEIPETTESQEAKDQTVLVIGSLVAALLILLVAVLVLRQKQAKKIPPLAPEKMARRELEHLLSLQLLEQGKVREFYYRLTAILRRYVELRYDVRAPEQTTEEFLAAMREHENLPREQQDVLSAFLATADLVRYARHEPPKEDVRAAFDVARQFVETTTATAKQESERELSHAS